MMRDVLEKHIVSVIWNILYFIITVIYLIKLSNLNTDLERLQSLGKNSFELVKYDNYSPLYYFGYALLLILFGIALILNVCFSKYRIYSEIDDIIYYCVVVLVIILLIILIIYFITIPILKIILTVVLVTVGGGYVLLNN